MRERKIEITLSEYSSITELGEDEQALVRAAMEASSDAYAPYSGFKVGAAVLLGNGQILKGNNRENAAFPSGSCAERTVLGYAGANHPGEVIPALAVCASIGGSFTDEPVSPCGSCRQLISEEEERMGSRMKIIMYGKKRIEVIEGISGLLPLRFNGQRLKV